VRWTIHGERSVYDSEWVNLRLADVEIPGGPRFEHHVVRLPAPATGVVVHRNGSDGIAEVLLLWRHRFIVDTWGWEVPAGRVDPGETAAEAAAREVLEETGWRCGPLVLLNSYAPTSGVCDARFVLFAAEGATYVGEPADASESERIEWVDVPTLLEEIRGGRVDNGLSLTALLWCFTFGVLQDGQSPRSSLAAPNDQG
jgi:8-oxo-dGTP pyrophosphatase MutT (NUDIX family)